MKEVIPTGPARTIIYHPRDVREKAERDAPIVLHNQLLWVAHNVSVAGGQCCDGSATIVNNDGSVTAIEGRGHDWDDGRM